MYLTMIGFQDDLLGRIEQICEDISKKDKSFNFKIYKSKFPQYKWVLIIDSETEDIAHRRGLLFTKKYLALYNLLYWVKGKT